MMATQQEDKPNVDQEKKERRELDAIIGNHVISALGRPGDLYRVQVSPLWNDHFRANVLVGVDAASVKVGHSYFLVTDGEGNIIASTPKIIRRY
jgi:hypothetical protein